MTTQRKNIVLLGSSGSIGRSTLEVIEAMPERFRVVAISVHRSFDVVVQQAQAFRPRWVVATDSEAASQYDWSSLPPETELLTGDAGIAQVVSFDETEVVVAAIVGSAGLLGTWKALEAGKTVALANKETLVMAGELVSELAQKNGAAIIPIDSEHSALFQAMRSGTPQEVKRIVLTASGGPLRQFSDQQLAKVTVQQALDHPTWEMGPKITVDSATLMNKALEIVEARWLFDLKAEQIEVVIHPQSIVHSMVEFVDGSVIAQLSPPDMKLPIQYALTYPERLPGPAASIEWGESMQLDFEPPNLDRWPALALGREVASTGGTAGAVVNAANEQAVAQFLLGKLRYNEIVPTCRRMLERHPFVAEPSLQDLIHIDHWAREEILR